MKEHEGELELMKKELVRKEHEGELELLKNYIKGSWS